MEAYFVDSSSLVKRFAGEVGTRWLIGLFKFKPSRSIYAARITFVEVSSALARKANLGQIRADSELKSSRRLGRAFEQRISSVEVNERLVLDAVGLARKHLLRGYDAIQLAAALRIARRRTSMGASGPIFVSSDNDLNKAAVAEGLKVENPHDHP